MQSLSRQEIVVLVLTSALCMVALHRLEDAYPGAFPVIWGPRLLTEILLAGAFLVVMVVVLKALFAITLRRPWLKGLILGIGLAIYSFSLGLIR